jgi:hypothetical protein
VPDTTCRQRCGRRPRFLEGGFIEMEGTAVQGDGTAGKYGLSGIHRCAGCRWGGGPRGRGVGQPLCCVLVGSESTEEKMYEMLKGFSLVA